MQNKGFIRVFAIVLTLISLFYLSFSVVGWQYERKATEYAKGNLDLKNQYLDSLSTEKIYLGYTLKQVREKGIGLGLDLKGGMNVIVEMDVAQVLRSLANTDDPQFNQALQETVNQNRSGSSSDFITLFQQNYERINPNGKLANIFSITMSDRVSPTASNDDVIQALRNEVKSAASNSFNVLRTRIDRFGVVSPNIQQLDQAERILIEMPGITEPDRVRNLLQGSANLEFWKTYNVNELAGYLNEVNARSSEYALAVSGSAAQSDTAAFVANDSLQVAVVEVESEDSPKITKSFIQYFAQPYFAMGSATGPILGTVNKNDTAAVSFLFRKYKDIFPADVRFKWGFKAVDQRETLFELFALKGDKVHKAVVAAGEKVSGITIHYVNENYDEGDVIFQAECALSPADSPEEVAQKVHQLEYRWFPQVIAEVLKKREK